MKRQRNNKVNKNEFYELIESHWIFEWIESYYLMEESQRETNIIDIFFRDYWAWDKNT